MGNGSSNQVIVEILTVFVKLILLSLERLEFKNEQLKFFPFNVTFKGKALDTQKNDSLKKDGKAKALSSTGILRTATEIN